MKGFRLPESRKHMTGFTKKMMGKGNRLCLDVTKVLIGFIVLTLGASCDSDTSSSEMPKLLESNVLRMVRNSLLENYTEIDGILCRGYARYIVEAKWDSNTSSWDVGYEDEGTFRVHYIVRERVIDGDLVAIEFTPNFWQLYECGETDRTVWLGQSR